MKKILVSFVLIIWFAVPARATDNTLDLANINSDLRLDIQNRAEPAVSESYEYYEIYGDCEKELRRQMTRNGTKWGDGKTYDSVTTWNVDWDYDYKCRSGGCTADSFNSKVKVTIRYPKWVNQDKSSRALRDKWDNYMKNLVLHEHGHRDLAVKAAAGLAHAVSVLPPAPSRSELDRQIEELSNNLMAKMADDQREYDAETIHGTTQGAVFP